MKVLRSKQHRRLLFRSYLVIVGGLIVMAAVLDYGLGRLQAPESALSGAWIDGNLDLIEVHLGDLPASEWPAAAEELERRLGFPVRVLPPDHVVGADTPADLTREAFDEQGRAAYFRNSTALGAVVQVGPLATAPRESTLVLLIPPLFYLSIFVFVGLWLWPLFRDLNILTDSARSFATDYRKPIDTRGKVTRLRELAGSLDDMSGRISGLIQRQKELTGALSHEMRTPLARIKFALAVSGDQSVMADELHSIGRDVQEIEELITSMLDYARLDYPDRELDLQLIRADAWLAESVDNFRPAKQGVHIQHQASKGLARFDARLMKLALSNLLVNACRYARSRVYVDFSIRGKHCQLSVEDDGLGIPEAERQTVFKAFTRLDDSRNRETGGHGLGLAIVARVARLHGGSARADESPHGGAQIVIAWDNPD